MTITTDGGNVLLRGTSTGSGAGVSMGESSIDGVGSPFMAPDREQPVGSVSTEAASRQVPTVCSSMGRVLMPMVYRPFTTLTISGGDIDLLCGWCRTWGVFCR